MKAHTLLLATAVLSACATQQERAVDEQRKARAYTAALQQRCAAYGFRQGTDAFATCMQREHEIAQADRRARLERSLETVRDAERRPKLTCRRFGDEVRCY